MPEKLFLSKSENNYDTDDKKISSYTLLKLLIQ